jgi:hypothetical protein
MRPREEEFALRSDEQMVVAARGDTQWCINRLDECRVGYKSVRLETTDEPHSNPTVELTRRGRVSQLTWCGECALIRAAASTPPLDCYVVIHT